MASTPARLAPNERTSTPVESPVQVQIRPPRTGQTLGESKVNRLFGRCHDDRDLRRRLLHSLGDSVDGHHHHLDVEVGEFGGKSGKPLEPAIRVSRLNRNILALDVAQLT